MTAQEILTEFDLWLLEQPDTPARRWVVENPPHVSQVFNAVRNVERRGRLEQIVLSAA